MTREEFDKWIGEKLKHFKGGYNWLRHKAGFFCADMFIDYGEINEIVQQTIEVMLYNLEAIPYETADNYAYWTMRNVCLNFFYHHRKRYCCVGEFDQYEGIADIDYVEDSHEKRLEAVYARLDTQKEKDIAALRFSGKTEREMRDLGFAIRELIKVSEKMGLRKPEKKRVYIKRYGKKGRLTIDYPATLAAKLDLKDKAAFEDYYVLKKGVVAVKAAHGFDDKSFKAFQMRVARAHKRFNK